MYFQNYGLAKKCLDKYLKSAISQYTLRRNIVNTPKNLSNYHGGTFIILIDNR